MSGPTIRFSDATIIPDVSIASDVGNTMEITNLNDFDLGLLGNKQKITTTPPRPQSPTNILTGNTASSLNDGIEFVNLEDTNATFQLQPPAGGDTIRIIRDTTHVASPVTPAPSSEPIQINLDKPIQLNSGSSAFKPIQEPPTPIAKPEAKSWFSNVTNPTWFGGSTDPAAAPATTTVPVATAVEKKEYLTAEQEIVKKTEALTILERMDRRGIGGTKMTMMNSYEEIQAELSRRKDSKALEASLRFQRSMLTTVTNGMEFLNNRYDPIGVNLDGWSEQINENLEDYDEIFEELYDKYKDRTKVAPEVRLIMSLGLSAAMCHVTNTMFKSRMPGMDDILRKNPDLAKQMAQAAAEQAVGPGFAKFVSMGMGGGGGGMPAPMGGMPMGGMPMGFGDIPMPQFMQSNNFPSESSAQPQAPSTPTAVPTARREIRGPTGVEDIIEKLNNAGESTTQRPVPPIDADDIGSVASGMTTNTMRRQGLSSRRRVTTQPTGATLTLNV